MPQGASAKTFTLAQGGVSQAVWHLHTPQHLDAKLFHGLLFSLPALGLEKFQGVLRRLQIRS
jgi:hypothetical protein